MYFSCESLKLPVSHVGAYDWKPKPAEEECQPVVPDVAQGNPAPHWSLSLRPTPAIRSCYVQSVLFFCMDPFQEVISIKGMLLDR